MRSIMRKVCILLFLVIDILVNVLFVPCLMSVVMLIRLKIRIRFTSFQGIINGYPPPLL